MTTETMPARAAEVRASAPPVVALRGVGVRLAERWVLRDLTLDLAPAEFLAVLGPNGAGKTTLIRVILGQIEPDEGEVFVAGRGAGRRGSPAIGYVPQFRLIDPETPLRAFDFAALGLPIRLRPWLRPEERSAVWSALEWVGAEAYAAAPVGRLSGGERQRLYLAQALLRHPSLLLLDEPTSSLDADWQRRLVALVDRVRRERGAAVIFVSHQPELLADVADRMLLLEPGRHTLGPVPEVLPAVAPHATPDCCPPEWRLLMQDPVRAR